MAVTAENMRQFQTDSIDRLLCFGISLIAGALSFPQAGLSQPELSVEISPIAALPIVSNNLPFNHLPGLSLEHYLAQSAQSDFTCTTDGYSAQIRWQTGQPTLTFGSLSAPPSLSNTPVEPSILRGIATYTTLQGEAKTAVFVYSDGTCAVTITDAFGEVTVNELGEVSGQVDNTATVPISANETLVSFQTTRNAVRIFMRSGETLINIYSKDDRITWLNGVPVTVEQTAEGTRYINTRGETSVEVFVGNSGNLLLIIDGKAEEGF